MTKIITAVRAMPEDLRQDILDAAHTTCSFAAMLGFVATAILWAPAIAKALH